MGKVPRGYLCPRLCAKTSSNTRQIYDKSPDLEPIETVRPDRISVRFSDPITVKSTSRLLSVFSLLASIDDQKTA